MNLKHICCLLHVLGFTLLGANRARAVPAATAQPIRALLCTGDYGMWAQDRVPLIEGAVTRAAPGKVSWESDQSYNFVQKLATPGFAQRFDVIVCGDVALGQMTTTAQQNLVRFVQDGGGFIYVVVAKATLGFNGARAVEPLPLADILPYQFPVAKTLRDGATAFDIKAPVFAGLDFSTTPWITGRKPADVAALPPFLMERMAGRGRVLALFGAFGADYKYVKYATFEKVPGGWDAWPQLGDLWWRLLDRAAYGSPARSRPVTATPLNITPLQVRAVVDATKTIDDIRAANFSIVALQQLYNEDGGSREALFLDLNPRDWFDRRTQEVLSNTKGRYPDKAAMLQQFNINGILMADNSYGSYAQWDDKKFDGEVARYLAAAKQYPGILTYFQPGNEPPLNEKYFQFHNRITAAMLQGAPALQVIGPNTAFNIAGVDEKGMRAFIAACGKNTDLLNWHIYARCPQSVRDEVRYWSQYATGKLRTPGPARVMFTEADAWNTEDSQFNYLMERAFTFLPMPEIAATFQYCMEPRSEGGPYNFGVLQPDGEMAANYNGYWIWRDLRGKMVQTTVTATTGKPAADEAASHIHVLSSNTDDGKSVTVVVYYDTGAFDAAHQMLMTNAKVAVSVKLPPGQYQLRRSDAAWNVRQVTAIPDAVHGTVTVAVTLAPCHAAAFTWTRQ